MMHCTNITIANITTIIVADDFYIVAENIHIIAIAYVEIFIMSQLKIVLDGQ